MRDYEIVSTDSHLAADENDARHRFWSGLDLPHPPSWYVRHHCKFAEIPDDEREKIVRDNAVRYFHLDHA